MYNYHFPHRWLWCRLLPSQLMHLYPQRLKLPCPNTRNHQDKSSVRSTLKWLTAISLWRPCSLACMQPASNTVWDHAQCGHGHFTAAFVWDFLQVTQCIQIPWEALVPRHTSELKSFYMSIGSTAEYILSKSMINSWSHQMLTGRSKWWRRQLMNIKCTQFFLRSFLYCWLFCCLWILLDFSHIMYNTIKVQLWITVIK